MLSPRQGIRTHHSKHTNSMFHYHSVIILGIQQENRHIRQLQHENKELRAALEEHQNAIELIMSKYRQHITSLVHSSKLDNNAINEQKSRVRYSAKEILIICTTIEIIMVHVSDNFLNHVWCE